METIKRNKSREMKSAARTVTLKHIVYEGDDIRFRISDSYRFFSLCLCLSLRVTRKKAHTKYDKELPEEINRTEDLFALGEN